MFVSKNEKTEMVFFSETHHSHYQIAYKMFNKKLYLVMWVKIFRHYCGKDENYVSEISMHNSST